MFMWAMRGFIFSLSIAILIAISSPVRASDNIPETKHSASVVVDFYSALSDVDDINTFSRSISLMPLLVSDYALATQKIKSNKQPDNKHNDQQSPNKTPALQLRVNPNISLPPFERQAASTFGATVQIEPIFLLAYEFQPEVLGIKHFLAPLSTNSAVPWYLRADAANNHGRTAGWKDGNTLYTGTITYLS